MPNVAVKLYSVLFKFLLNRRLQTLLQSSLLYAAPNHPFDPTSRPKDQPLATPNPTFSAPDGVATKDLPIDPLSSLSLRIFLPITAPTSIPSKISGYAPVLDNSRNYSKLPIIVQFHGGGFLGGSNEAVGNDAFCRRMARLLDAVTVAVGYRLAPEKRFPVAFEDGVAVLGWLAKQANLADFRRLDGCWGRQQRTVDGFGASMVEPWLAA